MADETELFTLPVFPLAVVLLPGELLPLHVFEERYKAMLGSAIDGDKRFGLSFHGRAEVGRDSLPEIGSVGCVAQITAVVPLEGGRMNVLSVGTDRYVLRGYSQYEPFLIAEVETFDDELADDELAGPLAAHVRELFGRLTVAARTLSDEAGGEGPDIEASSEMLSFVVAANLGLDAPTKRKMLETTDTIWRLEAVHERLSAMVETYEYRAQMHGRVKNNGHGKKLPDFSASDD